MVGVRGYIGPKILNYFIEKIISRFMDRKRGSVTSLYVPFQFLMASLKP